MLGFSLPKIIILCFIIAVIWYGFKIFGRGRLSAKSNHTVDESNSANSGAVDMVRCVTCGDYFVPIGGSTSCNKHNSEAL